MIPVLLLLGSNVEPHRHLPQALEELTKFVTIDRYSKTYLTEPVGDAQQPPFWNRAVAGWTVLSLESLLRQLADLEFTHQRQRDPARPCGPRTLDVDIMLYGRVVGRFGKLELPSPLLCRQGFALIPAAEAVPNWPHPLLGCTLAALVQRVDHRGVMVLDEETYA